MFKSNVKRIAITFFIFAISLLFVNNNYVKSMIIDNNEANYWKIAITSDTKDFKDTQVINFKVDKSSNVVNGNIAPGLKAKAIIEIDLTDTKVPVDVKATVDDHNLYGSLKLNLRLDGEKYINGTIKTFELEKNQKFTEQNGKKELELELEWIGDYNDSLDTNIGNKLDKLEMPITIDVTQHI